MPHLNVIDQEYYLANPASLHWEKAKEADPQKDRPPSPGISDNTDVADLPAYTKA